MKSARRGGAAPLLMRLSARRRKMNAAVGRLELEYGKRRWRRFGSAMDMFVEAILSQNTSDANSMAGFRRLKRRFRSWDKAAEAPLERIADCIRVCGLSNIKAPRIQAALRRISAETHRADLEFLASWPAEKAVGYLTDFDGVGPKTARCVLLFAFGMPVFPVDTHIRRIATRLGLLGASTSDEKAHETLAGLLRPEDRYAAHVLLIAHGRAVCKAASPLCRKCCLRRICPSR